MIDLPAAMLKQGRGKDQVFFSDEQLYRRVPPQLWELKSNLLEIDAIALPDMSVLRSKYAHPEWTRFNENGEYEFDKWGVIGFRVADIPDNLIHLGSFQWTFEPRHVPLARAYPHAEVWAFEDGRHADAKSKLDPNLHLRWREMLLRRTVKLLGPDEDTQVRQEAPS